MSHEHVADVIVIGGGPSGSTISTLLAKQGWDVTLFEKAYHPRFHIGESLLPMNLPILERLGVLDEVDKIGMPKYGAEFNSSKRRVKRTTFYFSKAVDKNYPMAYEVKRAEFDHILLKNSVANHVNVCEGCSVKSVDLEDVEVKTVQVKNPQGETEIWKCRYVVDASGRDTFISKKLGLKKKNPRNNSAAIFAHFKGVVRRTGRDEGNISLYWFEHGWFWMIPLKDGLVSVGAVCFPEYLKQRKSDLNEFLWQTIQTCPGVYRRMLKSERVNDVSATGNYSYNSSKIYGDGFLLVGDAYAFLDPVFSSGVYFAMSGAEMGAKVVHAHLNHDENLPAILSEYEKQVKKGLGTLSWFIYRFNSPAIHRMFMLPVNLFRMEEAILSMLAGDVFRKTPIKIPLAIFKSLYYFVSLLSIKKNIRLLSRKKRNAKLRFN